MGGARCSYRNCTIKSDGKTHLFRYPVFDKRRCYQWLREAKKLEFVNLTVEQLKNRMICGYHFPPEMFMNSLMDKLKNTAVPTLMGPYCKDDENEMKNDDPQILFWDTEKELLSSEDKKQYFQTKYIDFLCNDNGCDVYVTKPDGSTMKPVLNNSCKQPEVQIDKALEETHLKNHINSVDADVEQKDVIAGVFNDSGFVNPYLLNNLNSSSSVSRPKKVNIISEKKIQFPLKIPVSLEPVSPRSILRPPKKSNKVPKTYPGTTFKDNSSSKNKNYILNQTNNIENVHRFENVQESQVIDEKPKDVIQTPPNTMKYVKASPARSRIIFEKNNSIEEKRQFNQKLTNFIKTSLTKIIDDKVTTQQEESHENQHTLNEVQPDNCNRPHNELDLNKRILRKRKKKCNAEDSEECSSDNSNINGSNKDSIILHIEKSMKNMEKRLLDRIDENSKKICELQNNCSVKKTKSKSRDSTQDAESYKRHLYDEISQYISPSVKSLLYEELFLNYWLQPKQKRRNNR